MVIFSAFMLWAYSPNEYNIPGSKPTGILRPLWDRYTGPSPQSRPVPN